MSSVDRFTITKHGTLWVGMQLSNPCVDHNVGWQARYIKIYVDHQDDMPDDPRYRFYIMYDCSI